MGGTRTVTATVLVAVGETGWTGGEGQVLSRAQDRTVVVFDSVGAAVAAAQEAADDGAAVGLAVGELTTSSGWWAGPAYDIAEALAERARRAGGGHIVTTTTVAALAPPPGRSGGLHWVPVGPVAAGSVGTVDCVEAAAALDDPPAAALDVPLPAVLGLDAEFPFVPRREAWQLLTHTWALASTGGRRVVLVGGEAGSGKTRLLTELSRWVHERGGAVMYGACGEQPTVPYEPFTMAVDQLMTSLDPQARSWLLRGRGDELARLVPRLSAEGGQVPAAARSNDPGAERFQLFSAVATFLAALASRRPLLLVLDDLHWARRPTVELLDHVIRSPGEAPVCVVATYRSTPAEVGVDFKAALPDLRRHPGVTRVVLPGFDRDGVRSFVRAASGQDVVPALEPVVDLLAEETGGNAFLLGELWRHLVDAGDLVQVGGGWQVGRPLSTVSSPEGVREVVGARLERLPEETRQLVHLAAVLGTRFSLAVLASASGTDIRRVLELLDPAVRAHIVDEGGPGEHRFIHFLVRRAVVDALPAGERRAQHLDIAAALERVEGDRAVADIAHHTLAAVPLVDPERAVVAGRRAADAARRAVAYDDAARLYEAVLPLAPPDRGRCELLLELADARMRAGDVAAAQERCIEATELARALDQSDLVVAAALVYDDANWRAALHGGVAGELLRAALPLASDPGTALRVQAGLGRALALSGEGEEAERIAESTIAAARELGDPTSLLVAYGAALFTPWTPANIDALRLYARELVEVARAENDLEWELGGLDKLLYAAVMAGDLDEARAIAAHGRSLSARIGQPLFRVLDLQANALLALGEGRFAEAESVAGEADDLAGFLSGNDAAGGYGVQMFSIRREQGRLDEARPLVEAVARFDQAGSTWRPALAVLYAELGLHEEAAHELHHLVADGLRAVPRDSLWWASLSYLADASILLGDRDAAAAVYRELVPARGLVVQVGNLLAAYGAVDRYLGGLSALLGRDRDAEAHFEQAMRIDRRTRMPVWLARTQAAYGRFLAHRARAGDLERAGAMLRASHEVARGCGMARLATETAELMDQVSNARPGRSTGTVLLGDPVRTSVGLTRRELAILPLLAEGSTNREIGERLHISQHTAANHIRSILLKTGCANRTEAAAWALRQGLVGD
ncbi:MAG TPA: AAA family ATPase [Acidimicrobiales bacterium]